MGKKVEFVNGYFYHVYNRGVEKRDIFLDKNDYYRFITYLHDFNTVEHIPNIRWEVNALIQGQTLKIIDEGNKLVDVICFSLIPNHFHFGLRQIIDNGVSKFMQKLGTGYTMYFNEKYDRTGRLFESKYKPKLIRTDEYLMHLSRYIHLNCLDLIESGWKEEGIKDWERANRFLEGYKWSSHIDYVGKVNFPHIINKGPLMEYFKTPEEHKRFTQSWMTKDMNILELEDLVIE